MIRCHLGILMPVSWPPKEVMQSKALQGLVITPLDTNLVGAIVGMYFGGSLVKR